MRDVRDGLGNRFVGSGKTPPAETEKTVDYVAGRHSVIEALRAGRSINKVLIAKGGLDRPLREFAALARERGIVVQEVNPAKLDALTDGVRHQGVVALAAPVAYAALEDVLARAAAGGEAPFLVLLDGFSDPRNVGAVLRTAEAAGAHGVLLPKRRGCLLTAAVARAAAGAVEYVPVVPIGSPAQMIVELKKLGLWVVGAVPEGGQKYYQTDLRGPVVIVVGGEGEGLSRLVRERCDFLATIPMRGRIASLNAAVACSILLYEAVRQRMMAESESI